MNGKVEKRFNDGRLIHESDRTVNESLNKNLKNDSGVEDRKCPLCGSHDVGCFANGLYFCRNCGRVWETER